ncbi:MAG: hypothetical protein JNM17_13355 [Archangium sp.]|nr:hypothetical protein [Archangium sp.]
MTRLSIVLPALVLAAACAQLDKPTAPGSELLRGDTEIEGLLGLERLNANGPYLSGATEHFRAHADATKITRVSFSATDGALTTSGNTADWTLPAAGNAELTLRVTLRDGTEQLVTYSFRVTSANGTTTSGPMTAEQALLTMPMPVLDGGSLEISGGGCEVRYEGTTANVALAFTTETHPALMYGRWNGSTWALEVVDAMGFNTGGVVRPLVSMQVEANGTPHIVYVRDNQVFYAVKNGAVWTRERVDSTATPYTTSQAGDEASAPSLALNGTTPTVLYATGGSTNSIRSVISVRTGVNTWTQTVVTITAFNTSYEMTPKGELVIDSAGRHIFPMYGVDSTFNYAWRLVSWTAPNTTAFITLPSMTGRSDQVLVSPTRSLIRNSRAVIDVALNATFSASTAVNSNVESTGGSDEGDLVWNAVQSRPIILHMHGSSLELVTPNAAGFWTFQQLGSASGSSAGLAVNPMSGDVSICYQANNRIMFQ